MLPKRLTLQLMGFLVLSGGVAANVFFLQTRGASAPGARVSEAIAWNIAAIEAAEFGGDTGSIGPAGESKAPSAPAITAAAGKAAPAKAAGRAEITRALQRELDIRGYETGAHDGVVGVMTRGAILAYEHDHGLPLTARPSEALLKAIILGEGGKAGAKSGQAETAEAADVIRSVQRSLLKLGYKAGSASGKPTAETARAVRAFEADQALPETGRISGPLIARLARLAGEGRIAAAPRP
jgi:peptidoglycan hydrolase-like protein with peptidoglycan-binding domain